MNIRRLINWLGLHFKFLKAKFVHIFLFFVVNIVIGSLGVWMPMLTSLLLEDVNFRIELSRVLAASGPYTFAVAYLAASTAFVAYEYLEERTTINRKSKTTLTTMAFVLIILCTLLSAFQTQIPQLSGAAPNTSTVNKVTLEIQTQTTSNIESPVQRLKVHELSSSEKLQLWLVAIAVVVGLVLYLISRWDDEDVKRMLQEHEAWMSEEAQRLGKMALLNNKPVGTLKL